MRQGHARRFRGLEEFQGALGLALLQGDAAGEDAQFFVFFPGQGQFDVFAGLAEHVAQDAALGQAQVGQFPVAAGQGAVQRRLALGGGAGQFAELGLDALVDLAFLLVEHRIGEQPHVVGRIAQGQLEDGDGVAPGHTASGEERGQALVGAGRMAQDVLQAAVAEQHLLAPFQRAERQIGHAARLPGDLAVFARQIECRKHRGDHPGRAQQRNEEGQGKEKQRTPGQRALVAPGQQQPGAPCQQGAAGGMSGGEGQGRRRHRQVGEQQRPAAGLEGEGAAKQPLAVHAGHTR